MQRSTTFMQKLSEIASGHTAIVKGFDETNAPLKLLEMGFLPGSQVKVVRYAPFGGPMHVQVAGYNLALRRSEAATIFVDFVV